MRKLTTLAHAKSLNISCLRVFILGLTWRLTSNLTAIFQEKYNTWLLDVWLRVFRRMGWPVFDAVHVHVGLCLTLLRCACLCYTVPKSSVVLALVFASAVEEPNIDPDFPSFIANPFSSSILVLLLSHASKGWWKRMFRTSINFENCPDRSEIKLLYTCIHLISSFVFLLKGLLYIIHVHVI